MTNECMGCGQTPEEVMQECNFTEDELDEYCVYTNSGHWYCHRDCYRDSR